GWVTARLRDHFLGLRLRAGEAVARGVTIRLAREAVQVVTGSVVDSGELDERVALEKLRPRRLADELAARHGGGPDDVRRLVGVGEQRRRQSPQPGQRGDEHERGDELPAWCGAKRGDG